MSKRIAHLFDQKWRSGDVIPQEDVEFSSLLLSKYVLKGLKRAGFKKPSPIQLEAIPVGRYGKDLLVQAKSGTGKTLVFTIVALEMLLDIPHLQVLILVPTREVATQICGVIQSVGKDFKNLKCCSFIGGLPVLDDKGKAIDCQIAVGTPGRIRQLISMDILLPNSIRLFILDEADLLMDSSFRPDIDEIFMSLPKDKQVIATSATYPKVLKLQLNQYFRDPYIACLNPQELSLLGTTHYYKIVSFNNMPLLAYKLKLKILEEVLKNVTFAQCLVFCNLISRVESLCCDIKKWGFTTTYITSAKEQSDRLKAIQCLKHFKCKVLVSSDVTARGIDAENVNLIVNFDLPRGTEIYLHRVGRAGRFGSKGVAVTFLTEKELLSFERIRSEGSFDAFTLPDPVPSKLVSIIPDKGRKLDEKSSDEREEISYSSTEIKHIEEIPEYKQHVHCSELKLHQETDMTSIISESISESQGDLKNHSENTEIGNTINFSVQEKPEVIQIESEMHEHLNLLSDVELKDGRFVQELLENELEINVSSNSKVFSNQIKQVVPKIALLNEENSSEIANLLNDTVITTEESTELNCVNMEQLRNGQNFLDDLTIEHENRNSAITNGELESSHDENVCMYSKFIENSTKTATEGTERTYNTMEVSEMGTHILKDTCNEGCTNFVNIPQTSKQCSEVLFDNIDTSKEEQNVDIDKHYPLANSIEKFENSDLSKASNGISGSDTSKKSIEAFVNHSNLVDTEMTKSAATCKKNLFIASNGINANNEIEDSNFKNSSCINQVVLNFMKAYCQNQEIIKSVNVGKKNDENEIHSDNLLTTSSSLESGVKEVKLITSNDVSNLRKEVNDYCYELFKKREERFELESVKHNDEKTVTTSSVEYNEIVTGHHTIQTTMPIVSTCAVALEEENSVELCVSGIDETLINLPSVQKEGISDSVFKEPIKMSVSLVKDSQYQNEDFCAEKKFHFTDKAMNQTSGSLPVACKSSSISEGECVIKNSETTPSSASDILENLSDENKITPVPAFLSEFAFHDDLQSSSFSTSSDYSSSTGSVNNEKFLVASKSLCKKSNGKKSHYSQPSEAIVSRSKKYFQAQDDKSSSKKENVSFESFSYESTKNHHKCNMLDDSKTNFDKKTQNRRSDARRAFTSRNEKKNSQTVQNEASFKKMQKDKMPLCEPSFCSPPSQNPYCNKHNAQNMSRGTEREKTYCGRKSGIKEPIRSRSHSKHADCSFSLKDETMSQKSCNCCYNSTARCTHGKVNPANISQFHRANNNPSQNLHNTYLPTINHYSVPSQHRCHSPLNHYQHCNHMYQCSMWHQIFINQWLAVQHSINFPF